MTGESRPKPPREGPLKIFSDTAHRMHKTQKAKNYTARLKGSEAADNALGQYPQESGTPDLVTLHVLSAAAIKK